MGYGIILIEKNALLCEIRKGGLDKDVSERKKWGTEFPTVELADSKSVFSIQIWQVRGHESENLSTCA